MPLDQPFPLTKSTSTADLSGILHPLKLGKPELLIIELSWIFFCTSGLYLMGILGRGRNSTASVFRAGIGTLTVWLPITQILLLWPSVTSLHVSLSSGFCAATCNLTVPSPALPTTTSAATLTGMIPLKCPKRSHSCPQSCSSLIKSASPMLPVPWSTIKSPCSCDRLETTSLWTCSRHLSLLLILLSFTFSPETPTVTCSPHEANASWYPAASQSHVHGVGFEVSLVVGDLGCHCGPSSVLCGHAGDL